MIKHRVVSHIRSTPSGYEIRVRSYIRGTEMRQPKSIPKYFSSHLPAEILVGRDVIQILNDAGFEGYIVGGATRDYFMNELVK